MRRGDRELKPDRDDMLGDGPPCHAARLIASDPGAIGSNASGALGEPRRE